MSWARPVFYILYIICGNKLGLYGNQLAGFIVANIYYQMFSLISDGQLPICIALILLHSNRPVCNPRLMLWDIFCTCFLFIALLSSLMVMAAAATWTMHDHSRSHASSVRMVHEQTSIFFTKLPRGRVYYYIKLYKQIVETDQ